MRTRASRGYVMAAPEGFSDTAALAPHWWTPPWDTSADPDGDDEPSVNIFAFHGTVSGYGESNTRGVNRIPIVRGVCNENTN